jgi:hypothetical protein
MMVLVFIYGYFCTLCAHLLLYIPQIHQRLVFRFYDCNLVISPALNLPYCFFSFSLKITQFYMARLSPHEFLVMEDVLLICSY